MIKSCRTCEHYNIGYGFRNRIFVGGYIGCDFKKEIADKCKKENFSKWEIREK